MSLEARLASALNDLGVSDDASVGIACSGGADSVALVHLASAIRPNVSVLHVDHGLRPDSEADAAFVERLARDLHLPFFGRRVSVDRKGSVEANARWARYAALDAMREELGLAYVATAHTLDDQAETVVLRAMRGGSVDGIAPVRERFVRPFLSFRRAELRAWLEGSGISWREDRTNSDLAIERNWVRHVLMPLMRERRAGVDVALARVADHTRDDRAALDAAADEVLAQAQVDDLGMLVPLDGVPPAIAARVLRRVRGNLDAESSMFRVDGSVAFVRPFAPPPLDLPPSGAVDDDARGIRIRTSNGASPAWRWRAVVRPGPLQIRPRRPGDRVATPIGTRKVQDVLVDAKVPRALRDLVGIVAHGQDIGWDAVAVVGRTSTPESSGTVIDVEPIASSSWARELLWNR